MQALDHVEVEVLPKVDVLYVTICRTIGEEAHSRMKNTLLGATQHTVYQCSLKIREGTAPGDAHVRRYPVAPLTDSHLAWTVSVVAFWTKNCLTATNFTVNDISKIYKKHFQRLMQYFIYKF